MSGLSRLAKPAKKSEPNSAPTAVANHGKPTAAEIDQLPLEESAAQPDLSEWIEMYAIPMTSE
jgi:hypothetical protein